MRPVASNHRLIAYGFLLPSFFFVGVVIAYPIAIGIIGSLQTTMPLGFGQGSVTSFAGFTNFRAILGDPVFWTAFTNNVIIFMSVPLRILLGLFIAQVLYRGIYGGRFFQGAIFLPFVAPIASIGIIFIYLLNDQGPFNSFLHAIGLGFLTYGWLTNQDLAMWSIMAVVLWTRLGFTILLFMARLMSVDRQIFQAAFVDGATWSQAYWRIGVPQLRGTMEFVAILGFIEAFSWSFAYVFVLAQGAFRPTSWILEIYLYDRGFRGVELGSAYAVGVVLFVMACLVAGYRVWATRKEIR